MEAGQVSPLPPPQTSCRSTITSGKLRTFFVRCRVRAEQDDDPTDESQNQASEVDSAQALPRNVINIDEGVIREHLDEVVTRTVDAPSGAR